MWIVKRRLLLCSIFAGLQMVRRNIVRLEPEGGLVMLMFLAIFSVSVVMAFLAQAMDIECVKPAKRRVSQAAKAEVSYPSGIAAGVR
jgi:hypothetical protein